MFKITKNTGFHITFENGWTVSVQFGRGNYCDNMGLNRGNQDWESAVDPSPNAEIAAWDENKNWHEFEGGDTVNGWVKPDDVLKFMNMIAAKESKT